MALISGSGLTTGLAWLIKWPPTQRMHAHNKFHILHSVRVFQLFFCSYNFDNVPTFKHCFLTLKFLFNYANSEEWTSAVTEWENSQINDLLTVTCSLFLSEDPESSAGNSYKPFTFSNNQGTCEILEVYSNLQHFGMINISSSVSIYILYEILHI